MFELLNEGLDNSNFLENQPIIRVIGIYEENNNNNILQ